MKIKQPTTTSLVLEALQANPDEFFTIPMLIAITGRNKSGEVSAALHNLRKRGGVDVVVQQGIGWWFFNAEVRTYKEIIPEIKRKRKSRKEQS